MKKYLLLTVSALALAATSGVTFAADMPARVVRKAPPPAPVAMPSWTGFYIGGTAGAIWHEGKIEAFDSDFEGITKTDDIGFIGGGTIGFNFQSGNIVWGLEGDFSGVFGDAEGTGPAFINGGFTKHELDWLATARARLGVAVNNGYTLLYVTGGAAFARVENSYGYNFGGIVYGPVKKTKVGWTAGAGIEHMLNQNWTLKVEGLYFDLGSTDYTHFAEGKQSTFSNRGAIGRIGLNYKW